MDASAHNLANMSTSGFRASHPLFRQELVGIGSGQTASFVVSEGTYKDTRPGAMRRTGAPLNAAVAGNGFFGAKAPNGVQAYTRSGDFQRGSDGTLLTSGGAEVSAQGGGRITIPANAQALAIDESGVISADGAPIGRLMVSEFTDPRAMTPIGGNLYVTDEAPQEATKSRVMGGMVENANVEPILEMTGMVDILRSYQSVQQLLQSENERLRSAVQKLTRVV